MTNQAESDILVVSDARAERRYVAGCADAVKVRQLSCHNEQLFFTHESSYAESTSLFSYAVSAYSTVVSA